jgi:AcrR family transcriptional regulator
MGRPREHDARTAAKLLAAAERMVQERGPDALSVRGVAAEVGTTTRAVYSLFDSKAGLMAALAAHGFEILRDGVAGLPVTDAPEKDLVEAGLIFRRFATEHPSLFRIAFQTNPSPMRTTPAVRAAANSALEVLKTRIARLRDQGLLGSTTVDDATLPFHAVCEGLAGLELRGTFSNHDAERLWRHALSALVHGLTSQAPHQTAPLTKQVPSQRPSRRIARTKPA